MTIRKLVSCAACLFGLAVLLDGVPGRAGTATTVQCTTISGGDVILMRAHFEIGKGRVRTFTAGIQAKARFGSGRPMIVTAEGVEVGRFKTEDILGGDVAGVLALNDAPLTGDHTQPFPSDFPAIGPNAPIAIESDGRIVLGCRLE